VTHPNTEVLQALVEGTLDREKEAALLAHIEECETCLEQFERASAAEQIPLELNTQEGDQGLFRRRLMHRINQEQTRNAIIHFVVTGFIGLLAFVFKTLQASPEGERTHASDE
jgi:hypothetical protein